MSENKSQDTAARQRRVKRLKRLILFTLFTSVLLPYIFCAIFMMRLRRLDQKVDELSRLLVDLQLRLEQQQAEGSAPETSGEEVSVDLSAAPAQTDLSGEDARSVQLSAEGTVAQAPLEEEASHKVYLTFDDGPSPYTDQILDILAEYDVKATFFVVGKEDEASRKAIQRIVEEGHTLGMHSYTHKYRELYASLDSFQSDLEKEQTYLKELTGVESRVYRFPGGSSNTVSSVDMQLFADYLHSQGIEYYDWNVSSGDGGAQLLKPEELLKNSTRDLKKRSTAIILLHDSAVKPTTVEALPAIIEKIQEMEDTKILPITDQTEPVQHIQKEK